MKSIDLIINYSFLFVIIIFLLFILKYYKTALSFLLFLLYFHRVPNKIIPINGSILSPAYGTIRELSNNHISIFLNVNDVHLQYCPCDGKIISQKYIVGNYCFAQNQCSDKNSTLETIIDTEFGKIKIKQISGIIARKIISFKKVGDSIKRGELFGFIRFGSRVDLDFIDTIVNFNVDKNDKVIGGETILVN